LKCQDVNIVSVGSSQKGEFYYSVITDRKPSIRVGNFA